MKSNLKQLRFILFFTGIMAVILSSVMMWQATARQELWAHWPLLHLIGIWTFSLSLCFKWLLIEDHAKPVLLSVGAGLLFYFGFPTNPFPFFLAIAFIPLLILQDQIEDKHLSARTFFWQCFFAFWLWNILSTFWVTNTAYGAGVVANTANALLMCLPMMAYHFVKKHLGISLGFAALISCWISFEYLHMRWDLLLPWLTLGNGLAKMHWGIQWYEFTGVFGGSLWLLLLNVLFYRYWVNYGVSVKWNKIITLVAWTILPLGISLILYMNQDLEKGRKVEVAIVQPNIEPHYGQTRTNEILAQDLVKLTLPHITDSTDYILMPETTFNIPNLDTWDRSTFFTRLYRLLVGRDNLHLITGMGAFRYVAADSGDVSRSTTRSYESRNGPVYYENYNCAVQVSAQKEVQEYYKAIFVPGAEFFPFHEVFFMFKPLVDKLGGAIEGYRTIDKYNNFEAGDKSISTLICYESIFGEYTNRVVRKGGQAIFVISNDGWWDNTSGHKQHMLFSRLRAIENRRDIARSANMGNCCFINRRGDIRAKTSYGEMGVVRDSIHLNDKHTLYNVWGDLIGRVSLFLTGLLLLRSIAKRISPANQ